MESVEEDCSDAKGWRALIDRVNPVFAPLMLFFVMLAALVIIALDNRTLLIFALAPLMIFSLTWVALTMWREHELPDYGPYYEEPDR